MELRYITGNAVKPEGDGKKLILHVVNDEGKWGSGFVLALNKEFGTADGSPQYSYYRWFNCDKTPDNATESGNFKLGQFQFVTVKPDVTIVNMIGQSTPGGYKGFAPIRYQSLEECLLRVRDAVASYKGKLSLHGCRFGSGLAGGSWPIIEDIILRVFKDTKLTFTIYDLPVEKK